MVHTSVTVMLWLGMTASYTLHANAPAHHLRLGRATRKQQDTIMSLHRLRGAQAPAKECADHMLNHMRRRILSTQAMDNEEATRTPTANLVTWRSCVSRYAYMDSSVRTRTSMQRLRNGRRNLRAPRLHGLSQRNRNTKRLPISEGPA